MCWEDDLILMITYLTILLGLTALLSILFLKKYVHPADLFVTWLFTSSMLFVFSNIIELNQQWIQLNNGTKAFWSLTLFRLLIGPCLTVWLILTYSIKSNGILKLICTGIWIFIMIGLQFLQNTLGLIHFKQWNLLFSFIEWTVLWLLTVSYWRTYTFFIKKEEVIK
jgi:hypothetical protein